MCQTTSHTDEAQLSIPCTLQRGQSDDLSLSLPWAVGLVGFPPLFVSPLKGIGLEE